MNVIRCPWFIGKAIICLIALVLTLPSAARAQSETLRWKLQPGQSLDVEVKMNLLQVMKAMEMEMPIEMIINMKWDVTGVSGDEISTEQSITRMRMKLDNPFMGNVEIDTDKGRQGADEMMAGPMFDMIGEKFKLVMNNRGEVTKLEVPNSLSGGNPMNPAGQMFNADSLKQMSSMIVFPEGPVAVGDSWETSESVEMPPMGKMNMTNRLTYKGTESVDGKRLHRIDVDTKIDMNVADNEMGFSIEVTKASGKSTIYFDNEAGCVAKQNGSQDMEMSIDAGGQKMDMSMKQELSITFKKAN
ncbi:MAG TPA: DUF6263 family protein [Pirellulaceae bacterium]|nr:DUF6263 family protein [Pirellulaceae bacterium]